MKVWVYHGTRVRRISSALTKERPFVFIRRKTKVWIILTIGLFRKSLKLTKSYPTLNPEYYNQKKYDQALETESKESSHGKKGSEAQTRREQSQNQSHKDQKTGQSVPQGQTDQQRQAKDKSQQGDQSRDDSSKQEQNIPGISQSKEGYIYSSHPHRYYFSLFGLEPYRPLDLFNSFYSGGMFDDEDLEFFDFRDRNIGHFGSLSNDFFGAGDLQKQIGQGKQAFSTSKSVYKRTTYEDGKRKTLTYTRSVDPEGKVDEQAKEELEDEKGEKKVIYYDNIDEYFKKEKLQGQQDSAGKQLGSDQGQQSQFQQQDSQDSQKGQYNQNQSNLSSQQSQGQMKAQSRPQDQQSQQGQQSHQNIQFQNSDQDSQSRTSSQQSRNQS